MSPELLRKPLHYDAARRRVWIFGQRCHHGATGALLVGAGVVAGSATLLASGTALMVHDWHDRSIWFQRGWQNQP
jgi:acyl dehydratase